MTPMVPATPAHLEELAARIRPADLEEIRALCPDDPRSLIEKSYRMAEGSWAWMVDGKVGAVWGVMALEDDGAALWMLGTEEVAKHGRWVIRYSRRLVAELLKVYASLEVLIDARYAASLRWAKMLGFDLGEPRVVGPAGAPFHSAILRRA